MSKKSITKNYLYNLTYQILVLILPLVTTPYLARTLQSDGIGTYSYTMSIMEYFMLFGSLGVSLYAQREIAYNTNNAKERSKVFIEVVLFRAITMLISIVSFYIIFARSGEYALYYKLLTVQLIANALEISWFFQGIEEFKKTVSKNIIIKLASVISIFIFVKTPQDLTKYYIIYAFSTLIGNISLWLYLPKYIEKVNLKEINIFRHFKATIALFIPQVATQIYTVLDRTMMGTIGASMSEVGYYEQAQKIIKILLTIVTSLGTVMIPRMASTYINGETEKLKQYLKKSFNFVLILSIPMIFGLISVSQKFVPLFFGAGYDKVVVLLNIISPIILIMGLSNVIGTQFLLPTKRQKEYTISVVIGAAVNFILNLLLIKQYTSIGASIATIIAELIIVVTQVYLIREQFEIVEILKMSRKYIIAGTLMFIVSIILGKIIQSNIISIVVQVATGTAVYFLTLIILKDEFLRTLINKIKEKFLEKIKSGQ